MLFFFFVFCCWCCCCWYYCCFTCLFIRRQWCDMGLWLLKNPEPNWCGEVSKSCSQSLGKGLFFGKQEYVHSLLPLSFTLTCILKWVLRSFSCIDAFSENLKLTLVARQGLGLVPVKKMPSLLKLCSHSAKMKWCKDPWWIYETENRNLDPGKLSPHS